MKEPPFMIAWLRRLFAAGLQFKPLYPAENENYSGATDKTNAFRGV